MPKMRFYSRVLCLREELPDEPTPPQPASFIAQLPLTGGVIGVELIGSTLSVAADFSSAGSWTPEAAECAISIAYTRFLGTVTVSLDGTIYAGQFQRVYWQNSATGYSLQFSLLNTTIVSTGPQDGILSIEMPFARPPDSNDALIHGVSVDVTGSFTALYIASGQVPWEAMRVHARAGGKIVRFHGPDPAINEGRVTQVSMEATQTEIVGTFIATAITPVTTGRGVQDLRFEAYR